MTLRFGVQVFLLLATASRAVLAQAAAPAETAPSPASPPEPMASAAPAPPPPAPPPPAPPPPPPGAYYAPAPPPAAWAAPPPPRFGPPPSAHRHDGFFLRLGLGGGGMTTDTDLDVGSVKGTGTLRGGGGMLELLLGGTPVDGLVIGGAWISHRFQEPRYETAGQSQTLSSSRLDMSLLGPFVQYYFDPTGGLHVQALVAIAEESFGFDDATGSVETQQSSGVGFGVGAGWDFWVGEQWSLGFELRFVHARVKDTSSKANRQTTSAGTLAFTATLH